MEWQYILIVVGCVMLNMAGGYVAYRVATRGIGKSE